MYSPRVYLPDSSRARSSDCTRPTHRERPRRRHCARYACATRTGRRVVWPARFACASAGRLWRRAPPFPVSSSLPAWLSNANNGTINIIFVGQCEQKLPSAHLLSQSLRYSGIKKWWHISLAVTPCTTWHAFNGSTTIPSISCSRRYIFISPSSANSCQSCSPSPTPWRAKKSCWRQMSSICGHSRCWRARAPVPKTTSAFWCSSWSLVAVEWFWLAALMCD